MSCRAASGFGCVLGGTGACETAGDPEETIGENFDSSIPPWDRASSPCEGESPIGGGVVAIGVVGRGEVILSVEGIGDRGGKFGGGVNDKRRRLLSCDGGEMPS